MSFTLNTTGTLTGVAIPSWLSLSHNGTSTSPWVLSGTPSLSATYAIKSKLYRQLGSCIPTITSTLTVTSNLQITSTSYTNAEYGFSWTYQVLTDEPTQNITYSMKTNCPDLQITSTGTVWGMMEHFSNFYVNVTAKDNSGGSAYLNWTVIVSIAPLNLHADINDMVIEMYQVSYNYSLVDAAPQVILKTEWDFGDGFGSNENSTIHVYPTYGTYNVTLVLYEINGDVAYAQKQITIPNPYAGATPIQAVSIWASWYGETAFIVIIGGLMMAVGYTQMKSYKAKRRKRFDLMDFLVLLLICIGIITAILILSGA